MERTRKAELTLQYLGGMKKLSAKVYGSNMAASGRDQQ